MRRWSLVLPLFALLLVSALVAIGPGANAGAQEATPIAGDEVEEVIVDDGAPEGMGVELLGSGVTAVLPATPAGMDFLRFTFSPNSGFALSPDDPATAFLYMESGTLSFLVDAPMTVQRAAGMSGPGAIEEFAPGAVFTMSEGDSTIFQPRVAGETLNLGSEPAAVLVLNIYPVEADAAATPVP